LIAKWWPGNISISIRVFWSTLKSYENFDHPGIWYFLDATPKQIGDVAIRFVPFQKDPQQVARYYQAADLYLHPARADTFPTTILEALACGTPVVASAVGGIPEQVVEGRTGFLVPVGDARALAGRVLDLLADEGLRLRMGRQAAEDAAQRFGLERMVGEYLAFYRVHHKGEGI
jgi:glycosyltransferase involved in cell wall biosynthesis